MRLLYAVYVNKVFCGRFANLTNYLRPQICGFTILICRPNTFELYVLRFTKTRPVSPVIFVYSLGCTERTIKGYFSPTVQNVRIVTLVSRTLASFICTVNSACSFTTLVSSPSMARICCFISMILFSCRNESIFVVIL
jgi:hypothetical protein